MRQNECSDVVRMTPHLISRCTWRIFANQLSDQIIFLRKIFWKQFSLKMCVRARGLWKQVLDSLGVFICFLKGLDRVVLDIPQLLNVPDAPWRNTADFCLWWNPSLSSNHLFIMIFNLMLLCLDFVFLVFPMCFVKYNKNVDVSAFTCHKTVFKGWLRRPAKLLLLFWQQNCHIWHVAYGVFFFLKRNKYLFLSICLTENNYLYLQ